MEASTCKKCNQPFNKTERKKVMVNCGHMFCLMCFFELMPPQENSLTCPIDDKVFEFSEAFKANLQ